MRFRASHFPFTEPSMEVDINCSWEGGQVKIGVGDSWLEILGSGMVHPNVIRHGGLDPEHYQGWAFGMGLDRIAMLKYGIPDLRAFFEADLRWLRHYGFRAFRCRRSREVVVKRQRDVLSRLRERGTAEAREGEGLPARAATFHPSLAFGPRRPLPQGESGKRRSAMKFTLSWLKDHLDTNASLDEIVSGLIGVGLEVEAVEDKAKTLAPFTVARCARRGSIPMPTACASAMSKPRTA